MPRRPSNHVDDPAAVGERLRAARAAAGLSQRQLAFPGCTAAYISRIEAGARIPSYQILREFAKRLGVAAEYLATGRDGDAAEPDRFFDAEIALGLGELDRARELYRTIADETESPAAVARATAGLGQVAVRASRFDDAIGHLETALESGQLPSADAATARDALGRAYCTQGRFEEAFDVFAAGLREGRERDDRFETVRFGVLLANAYADSGNFARAQEALAGILDLARDAVDPAARAGVYWSQSRLHSSQGNLDLAARYAQLALATLRATEHTVQAARALLLLAHIENDRGRADAAFELVEEGEPVVAAAGSAVDRAMFALERARALDARGDVEEAASVMLGAVARVREASPVTAARAYAGAARFFRLRGDVARALELYELAADQAVAHDRHYAETLTAMAEIYEELGDARRALELLKAAVKAKGGVGSRVG
jgi:tetratricopeptide (TPR) repeat protein